MRRTVAATLVALSTALTVLPATSASATSATDQWVTPSGATKVAAPVTAQEKAEKTLDRAVQLFSTTSGKGLARRTAAGAGPTDATLVLRDLFVVRDQLSGEDRAKADAILARPTDGASDPLGYGYSVPATKKCQGKFCVHYVTSTADAPPSMAWVNKTLKTMKKVYKLEVKKLGYRKPISDATLRGNNGGNGKFDVYLKDLGSSGLYGFCLPEFAQPGKRYGGGYCALDNDFAAAQFGGAKPENSLKVTAAHEFFHAIQFAYDFTEDHWFSESTATWMEERFADNVNDNRQYFPVSQLVIPGVPLDAFVDGAGYQYGNWVWWEYLSSRYGKGIVKQVWNRAAAVKGAPNDYSTQALKAVLKSKGGFSRIFTKYAAGNTAPARSYPEGKAYPSAGLAANTRLGSSQRKLAGSVEIDHMASADVRVSPDKSLKNKKWKLRISINGPKKATGPGAYVIVQTKKGKWIQKAIGLNGKGKGKTVVVFNKKKVRSVTVTLANTSTRFKCNRNNPYFSCEGNPRDDRSEFKLTMAAFK